MFGNHDLSKVPTRIQYTFAAWCVRRAREITKVTALAVEEACVVAERLARGETYDGKLDYTLFMLLDNEPTKTAQTFTLTAARYLCNTEIDASPERAAYWALCAVAHTKVNAALDLLAEDTQTVREQLDIYNQAKAEEFEIQAAHLLNLQQEVPAL